MAKLFSVGFWETIARLILRNRIALIIVLIISTFFFANQWNKMRLSNTEANLLPDEHIVNLEYNAFLDTFGEEGNLIVLGVNDSTLFSVEKFNAWNTFSEGFKRFDEIETIVALSDLQRVGEK